MAVHNAGVKKCKTKQGATAKITKLLDAKKTVPPTKEQLELLQNLGHCGPAPATKMLAHDLIDQIKEAKRRVYLEKKCKRKGMPPAQVARLVALGLKYGL